MLHALDHDLLLPENFVHHDRHPLPFGFENQQDRLHGVGIFGFQDKHLVHPNHRKIGTSDIDQFALAYHGFDGACFGLDRLQNREQRDDVGFLADPNRHPFDDGQRERQLQRKRRSLSCDGLDTDCPSEGFNVPLDDIHADAATGHIRHLFGRGKSRAEDQRPNLVVGEFFVFPDQPLLDGLCDNFVSAQAPSVVFHCDANASTFVKRIEPDRSHFRLIVVEPFFRWFQPMIGRIPDQMCQRITDGFDDRLIQLGFFSGEHQLNLLSRFRRQITDQSRKPAECGPDRKHADAHHPFLNLSGVALQLRDSLE